MVSSKKAKYIIVLFILLGIFQIARPPVDPDFGWHFKYGEYMVQNRHFLTNNIHSYASEGYEWVSFYWVPQIIFYVLYSNLPHVLVVILLSVTMAISIYLFLKKLNVSLIGKLIGLTYISYFLGQYLITSRPLYFSCIFLLVLTYILIKRKDLVIYTPILIALWSNFHADFLFGIMILTIYITSNLYIQYRNCEGLDTRNILKNLLFLILIIISTLITPYGIKLWETLFRESSFAANTKYIAEWLPLWAIRPVKYSSVIIVTITCAVVLTTTYVKRKEWELWYLITTVGFFILTLKSMYFFRLFILFTFPLSTLFWSNKLTSVYQTIKDRNLKKYVRTVIIICILLLSLISVERFTTTILETSNIAYWSNSHSYPLNALKIIKESDDLQGNMFNTYKWGGYLIWLLPEYKTFIDGRLASWAVDRSPNVFDDYYYSSKSLENFITILNKYEVSWILVSTKSNQSHIIKANPDIFSLIDSNDIYVLAKYDIPSL